MHCIDTNYADPGFWEACTCKIIFRNRRGKESWRNYGCGAKFCKLPNNENKLVGIKLSDIASRLLKFKALSNVAYQEPTDST